MADSAMATAPTTLRATPAGSLTAGYQFLRQGQLEEARLAYQRALEINPEERDALLGLAYIAHHQGQRHEAGALYRRVLRLDPENATASSGLLALLAEGDTTSAGGLARDLTQRHPDSATALATLGSIMAREGRLAEAQQAYFKAVTLEPGNALYTYNLAVALDRLHKPAEAIRYYERALQLSDPANPSPLIPRATILQRLEQLQP